LRGEMIPDGGLSDRARVHEAEAAVSAIGAIAKTIDAERTGILARGHAHPGGHGDRRNDAFEAAPRACAHEAPDIF
jgi:hypothetical protein